jgi:hypothetical protein
MNRLRRLWSVVPLGSRITVRVFALLLITVCGASGMRSQSKKSKDFVLSAPIGSDTAVRFFYYSGGDFGGGALLIRAVERGSPQLNTALAVKEGLVTYVSFDEMSKMTEGLAQLNLVWKESKKIERFKPFTVFDEPSVNAEIEVVGSTGTAKARLNGSRICEELGPLDSGLQTRRALLEFQEFRSETGCNVPGFNHLEYMQMILREHAKPQQGSPK